MCPKLFSRKKNDKKPVGGKVIMTEDSEQIKGVLSKGVPDIIDLIAPDYFDRTKNTVFRVGDYYVKTIFITGLPREVSVGWLNPFLNHDGDLDLSIHVTPFADRDALFELSKMIAKLDAALSVQRGNIRIVNELNQAITDLQQIRTLVQNNHSRLFQVGIMANLYNKDLEELEREADFLEGKLAGHHIHTRYAEGRMDEGYYSVSPLATNLLNDTYRILDTYAISTTLPFITADITHVNGFPFCINMSTGAPVFLDQFDSSLDNHNSVVLAMSGVGKSTTVKVKAGRALFIGERIAIMDIQGEYSKFIENTGGVEFVIGPESQMKFNPCEIEAEYNDKLKKYVVPLLDKYNFLVDLIGVMVGGMSSVQEAIVEEAIREVYTDKGFTNDPESLYERKSVLDSTRGLYKHAKELKKMPRLKEIVNHLATKGERVKDIVDALRGRYLEGGSLGFFDCESNVSLDELDKARSISFNLSVCPQGQPMRIAMQVIAGWITEKFLKRGDPKQKKRVITDEAHNYLDDDFSARALEKWVRQVRKYTAGIDVISQEARKFAEHPQGRAVIENCSTKIFLKQEDTTLSSLNQHFKLSSGISSFLLSCGKGQGVMMVGKKAVAFKVVPTPMEKTWVFTSALLEDDEIA